MDRYKAFVRMTNELHKQTEDQKLLLVEIENKQREAQSLCTPPDQNTIDYNMMGRQPVESSDYVSHADLVSKIEAHKASIEKAESLLGNLRQEELELSKQTSSLNEELNNIRTEYQKAEDELQAQPHLDSQRKLEILSQKHL